MGNHRLMHGLVRFLIFAGKVLLLAVPQFLISLAAIFAYTRAFIYPEAAVGLHLAVVVTGHVVFFSLWALVSRHEALPDKKWLRASYALSLLLKCLALNLVYLISYFSYQTWSAYITWQNLQALLPHIKGFHAALGPVFIAGLAGLLLFVSGTYLVLYRLTPRLLRWLRWSYADPASRRFSVILVGLGGLLILFLGSILVDGHGTRTKDPLYAFWSNAAEMKPVLTPAMLADEAARDYTPPADFRRRNVIVFIIDCLRADHLSFRGYSRATTPFLASLAAEGRLQQVEFAVANGNDSPQGIRAVLTSRSPQNQNIHNLKLHEVLRRAGYQTHVIATGDHTTLGGMRKHYGPDIDFFSDGLSSVTHSVNDDRGLLEALEKVRPSDGRPAFFYFHLMSAHTLGVREPVFQRWNPSLLKLDWDSMVFGGYNPEEMRNTYDNGILQADHFLAQIFSLLKAKGFLDDYVAVFTGDHGEGLGERGNYGHTRFLYMEDLLVPIIFMESEKVDYGPMPFASQVDIAPTLLSRLGLPRPHRWEGRSLYRAPAPQVASAASTRDARWRSVILQRDGMLHKYMFYSVPRKDFREYLFNLTQDPGERANLIANPVSAGLVTELRQLAAEQFHCQIPPPK